MRLGLILPCLGLAACSAQADRHGRWDAVSGGKPAVAVADEGLDPAPSPSAAAPAAAVAPMETVAVARPRSDADLINDHLEAEVVVVAALERLAQAALARLTAGPDPEAIGPELRWFPALGLVSAMERRVVYGSAVISAAVSRTADADRPFQISLVVPCQVTTRSGDGVAVAGTMPTADAGARDVLPRSTTAGDLGSLPEHLREAAARAIAVCRERDGVSETIMVEVTLVYDRLGETFVLP